MVEINNVNSEGINGVLRFRNQRKEDLFQIGATGTSNGMPAGPYYLNTLNVTAAATLVPSTHGGYVVYATTDALVFTLQTLSASTAGNTTNGQTFTLMNTASDGGAKLLLRTNATTDYMVGYGSAATTNCVISNTKATQRYGDYVRVTAGVSPVWVVTDVVGTWAFAATS